MNGMPKFPVQLASSLNRPFLAKATTSDAKRAVEGAHSGRFGWMLAGAELHLRGNWSSTAISYSFSALA